MRSGQDETVAIQERVRKQKSPPNITKIRLIRPNDEGMVYLQPFIAWCQFVDVTSRSRAPALERPAPEAPAS